MKTKLLRIGLFYYSIFGIRIPNSWQYSIRYSSKWNYRIIEIPIFNTLPQCCAFLICLNESCFWSEEFYFRSGPRCSHWLICIPIWCFLFQHCLGLNDSVFQNNLSCGWVFLSVKVRCSFGCPSGLLLTIEILCQNPLQIPSTRELLCMSRRARCVLISPTTALPDPASSCLFLSLNWRSRHCLTFCIPGLPPNKRRCTLSVPFFLPAHSTLVSNYLFPSAWRLQVPYHCLD